MSIGDVTAALSGRYRIEHELGAGGMATVYLAEDVKHRRKVAVKVLKPELAAVLGAERFLQEITTTAALQHPHILPLFDSGTADGFLYYVMPFIDGETVRAKLDRETQLGVDEALRIAADVADALQYAHTHGVIHRDIKPENILLANSRPMVADFGIALAVSAAAGGRMTETGLSLGTPHYMSPEQATAEKEISGRSDIYSLASVLYEMLTGEPPHMGNSAQQIIMKIITEQPQPITRLRKSVPPNVESAVARALEKLPADRFESVAQFASALANPAYGADLVARGRSPAARGLSMRGKRTVALVGLGALVAGIAGTKLLWRDRAEPPRTTRLMLEFPAGEQPANLSGFPFPMLAQMPDGSGLLYFGRGTTTGAQLMLRSWARLSATRLSLTVSEGCCVVLSPGGDSLAYLTGPHSLQVVPLSGGIPRVVADSGLGAVTDFGGGVDWASDGWLYASGTAGLIRVSPRGGKMEEIAALDSARGDLRHLWPAVLPGARAALVTVIPTRDAGDPARATIGVVDFSTGKIEILLPGLRAIYAPTGHLIVAKANGSLWAVRFNLSSLRVIGRERELVDTVSAAAGVVDLSLSPVGALAYTKDFARSFEAVWVERTGETRTLATDVNGETVLDPSISPDGRRLAVALSTDGPAHIWVKSFDGGPKSRLTFDGSFDGRPAWRPGTGMISYRSARAAGRFEMAEQEASGSGEPRTVRRYDDRNLGAHGWSPDGRWLLLRTDDQEAGNADIMGVRPGIDTVAKPLIATPAEELAPAVSPDGRWIAYSSNESGRREIYVRPFPETASARYQISLSGGTAPAWSRESHELFYIDGANNMVSVPVRAGPTFERGAPQVLFSANPFLLNPFFRQYDVTSDGKRFVMIRGETDAAAHIVVVFNFLEELKRLMKDAQP